MRDSKFFRALALPDSVGVAQDVLLLRRPLKKGFPIPQRLTGTDDPTLVEKAATFFF